MLQCLLSVQLLSYSEHESSSAAPSVDLIVNYIRLRKCSSFSFQGVTYLDHAGTTLFPESHIKGFHDDISRNIYGEFPFR